MLRGAELRQAQGRGIAELARCGRFARQNRAGSSIKNWWKAFNDPVLDRLIDQAYRGNLSLRIAGVRVLEARAQLGIAVGRLYPQAQQASGSVQDVGLSERSPLGALLESPASRLALSSNLFNYWQDQIGVNASWEIDFWGKFRRAIESADASLLQRWPTTIARW